MRKGEVPGGEEVQNIEPEKRSRDYVFGTTPKSKDGNERVSLSSHSPNAEPCNGIAAIEDPNNPLLLWKAKSDVA